MNSGEAVRKICLDCYALLKIYIYGSRNALYECFPLRSSNFKGSIKNPVLNPRSLDVLVLMNNHLVFGGLSYVWKGKEWNCVRWLRELC